MLQVESPLISVEWLRNNIESKNLIVLDATIPKVAGRNIENNLGYIPKSKFFDIKKKFSNSNAEFPNTKPSNTHFETEAKLLGINNDSLIVVYDQHGVYSSARAWWLFKHFGHTNVAVLNGGLPEWIKQGGSTISNYVESNIIGNFKARVETPLFTDFDGVNIYSNSEDTLIIDARPSKRFNGEAPEPRKGLRSGKIPNSVNLPYQDLLNYGKIKTQAELVEIFKKVSNNKLKLVFSCGSGITACILALGAELSGYKNLIVYDGSWTEYGTLSV